jgi:hypothetical protein
LFALSCAVGPTLPSVHQVTVHKITDQTAAAQASTCTEGVASRFDPGPAGCRPASVGKNGGGLSLASIVTFINRAAPIITIAAIATSFIPGVGEVTGGLALLVDALSAASTAADVATAGTSVYAMVKDRNKGLGVESEDFVGGIFSLLGASAAGRVFSAERGFQSAEEGRNIAWTRLGAMTDAAESHFSGPVSTRIAAYAAKENISGFTQAVSNVNTTGVDLGAAQATYDFINSTGLAYGLMFENPY